MLRAPACPGRSGWCRETLVLERLAWAAGGEVAPGLARDPTIDEGAAPADGPAAVAARAWLDRRGAALLSTVGLRGPALKGVVDQSLRDAGWSGADGPWWYVRGVVPGTAGKAARVVWVVLDPASGAVLRASPDAG